MSSTLWSQPASPGISDRTQLLAPLTVPTGSFKEPVEAIGFIAQRDLTVFVVFRGTQTLEDWRRDLNFPQMPDPFSGRGAVSAGFLAVYNLCRADVRGGVQNAAGAAPNVVITGHSLGAALAVLACIDLATPAAQGEAAIASHVALYSFAGPRVGNPAFASAFNAVVEDAWRVVNTEDLVTIVPFATPLLLPLPPLAAPLILQLGALVGPAAQWLINLTTSLDYEHVGTPVSFTIHNGSIEQNHAMQLYLDQVTEGTATLAV